jgi:hypothetical protein
MELLFWVVFLTVSIYASVKIADWGRELGLRWGEIFALGIFLSPVISILPPLCKWVREKWVSNFS